MNCNDERSLWVTWKHFETRVRYVIGVLTETRDKNYEFKYLKNEGRNNLLKALDNGFKLFPTFSFPDDVYKSDELFLLFKNRLPNKKRRDVQQLIQNRKLMENWNEFDLLRETHGTLPTDTLEFITPIKDVDNDNFCLEFYVAGVRFQTNQRAIENLKINDKLFLNHEYDNKFDENAIEIYTKNNERLGYIPMCYSNYLIRKVDENLLKVSLLDIFKDKYNGTMIKVQINY